jgi:hypothetical protein
MTIVVNLTIRRVITKWIFDWTLRKWSIIFFDVFKMLISCLLSIKKCQVLNVENKALTLICRTLWAFERILF